jgi:hypothetical protein
MDLMDLGDTPFVFGVFVAPLIVVVVLPMVIATRQSKRAVTLTSVLSAVVAGALITYWGVWGTAFDEVDAGRDVPSALDRTMNVAVGLSAVSAASLLALGAALMMSRSHPAVGEEGLEPPTFRV